MRTAIFFMLQLIAANACFAFEKVMVREECEAKWGDDYSMQLYCVEEQTTAGKQVDKIYQGNSTGTTESNILAKCQDKWPKDYSMVIYCYDEQLAAFKALQ